MQEVTPFKHTEPHTTAPLSSHHEYRIIAALTSSRLPDQPLFPHPSLHFPPFFNSSAEPISWNQEGLPKMCLITCNPPSGTEDSFSLFLHPFSKGMIPQTPVLSTLSLETQIPHRHPLPSPESVTCLAGLSGVMEAQYNSVSRALMM